MCLARSIMGSWHSRYGRDGSERSPKARVLLHPVFVLSFTEPRRTHTTWTLVAKTQTAKISTPFPACRYVFARLVKWLARRMHNRHYGAQLNSGGFGLDLRISKKKVLEVLWKQPIFLRIPAEGHELKCQATYRRLFFILFDLRSGQNTDLGASGLEA